MIINIISLEAILAELLMLTVGCVFILIYLGIHFTLIKRKCESMTKDPHKLIDEVRKIIKEEQNERD